MVETNRFTFRYLLASLLLLAAGYLALVEGVIKMKRDNSECWKTLAVKVGYFCVAMSSFAMCGLLARLAFLPIARLHSALSAIVHYICVLSVYVAGYLARRDAEYATKNVRDTQINLLKRIIKQNKNTDFGRRMNFASIKDRNDYRQMVPITTYKDYAEYIERIAKGENNVLTKDKVIRLTVSSGTTGKCKNLPATKSQLTYFIWGFLFPFLHRHTKDSKQPIAPLKMLELQYVPLWRFSECGIPIGPASAHPGKKAPFFVSIGRSTPPEAQVLMSEGCQTYIHFYYALCDRDLRWYGSQFGGSLLSGLEFFKKNWKMLADDVRHGRITNFNNGMPIEFYYKELKPLGPDPVRAAEIEAACEAGFEGIIKRLWPRVESILCVVTGSHAIFRKRLQYFAGPEIKLCSAVYGASEGQVGIAMNAKQDTDGTYTVLPTWAFFEFIPEEDVKQENPPTVFLDEVEIGKRYEIVVTSLTGFYRYRIGDIVHFVDRYNNSPVLSFCTRVGGILDVRSEKTTEEMVLRALHDTKWPGGSRVVEFTTTDCLSLANACPIFDRGEGLYYILFVEIENLTRAVNDQEETTAFDDALKEISYPYKSFRAKEAIKRPKIFTMPPGTFDMLKEFILQRNAAVSNQYKTPHYTTSVEILQLLYERAYPQLQ